MAVINIRGTGGAGKSHLVKSIMDLYPNKTPNFIEGRKRPMWYECSGEGLKPLFVPGNYEIPTGGCDTISEPDVVYALVTGAANRGFDVAFEGIIIGDDVRRCIELNRTHKVTVLALNTPLEQCLAGIQQRRDIRGDDRELNPKNTTQRLDRLKRSMMPRLKDAGVDARWVSREEAFIICKELLGFMVTV